LDLQAGWESKQGVKDSSARVLEIIESRIKLERDPRTKKVVGKRGGRARTKKKELIGLFKGQFTTGEESKENYQAKMIKIQCFQTYGLPFLKNGEWEYGGPEGEGGDLS